MEPTELEFHQKKCIELSLRLHDLELSKNELINEISNIKKWINAEMLKLEKEKENEKE